MYSNTPRSATFNFASSLNRWAIHHPWHALAALAIVTVVAATGTLNFRLAVDGMLLTPLSDLHVLRDHQLRREFHLGDPIVVLIDSGTPDGLFDYHLLSRVSHLSKAIEAIPGLPSGAVMSLATEAGRRVYPGTLKFAPFLAPIPDKQEDMEQLRRDIEENDLLDDVLVTKNRSGAAIIVRMPVPEFVRGSGVVEAQRREIFAALLSVVNSDRLNSGAPSERTKVTTERVSVIGAPVAELELGNHVFGDLVLLIPLAMGLLAWVVWLGFGRLSVVVIVLLKAGASLLFIFGLMGWIALPGQITTAIMPVVLICTSVSDEVFILARYQQLLSDGRVPSGDLARVTMEEMLRPATITSVMMAVGFTSFILSPIQPIAAFGALTATGITYCWAWSMIATPAVMDLLGPRRLGRRRTKKGSSLGQRVALLVCILATLRHPRVTLAVIGVSVTVLSLGAFRLQVQDSWIQSFAKYSPFRIETQRANIALAGTHSLIIYVEWPSRSDLWPSTMTRRGPLLDPLILQIIDDFEREVRRLPSVGKVIGPASEIKAAQYLYSAGRFGTRAIPRSPTAVAEVLRSLEMARGIGRRQEVFSDDLERAAILVLVHSANYVDTAAIMTRVRELESTLLAPIGAVVEFGGDLGNSQAMIRAIVSTQIQSLFLTVCGLVAVVATLTGSFAMAVISLCPSFVTIIGLFGAMGILGVHLGVATSMICGISLGIGADFGVYYLFRCASIVESTTRSVATPVAVSIMGQGMSALGTSAELSLPVVTDAASIAVGFGLLGLSKVPVNATLGLTVAFTVCMCAVLTLLGIGAYVAIKTRQA